jgi:DNA-binding response OmpR family regulator
MKKSATILLVEDEKSMLEGMSDLLNIVDIGYDVRVLTADNGKVGLDVMAENVPDLIVSDIMMPQMDGLEFLQHLRQNPNWMHIPLIFLTARNDRQAIHAGTTQGAQLYITKPFNSGELLELIKTQLDRTFQLQVTHQQNVDKLKKDLLQLLNHEFRTPLTYVTAYYEMLTYSVSQLQEAQDFDEYLRGIQVGSLRLTRLVESLIQVMDLRTREMAQQFQKQANIIVDFDLLIREAIQANRDQAEQYGIQIHYDDSMTFPPVFGVRHKLLTVLNALLDNAIKFTHHHKTSNVYVLTYTTDNELHVAIQDEGIGFPLQMASRLFELFFQYKRSIFEQQGAGVGLTIAKGIAELHNGRIDVDSQKGVGSTFSLVLPIYDTVAKRPFPTVRRLPQATVLIVEDEPHLLEGLKDILELSIDTYELTVLTAANGRLGLDVLADYHPQLIISDIMMPEMDGLEFLQAVRQNQAWVQIPFIFLTAKGEGSDIHHGRRSGAEEYITKPYDTNELVDLVLKQLDRNFQMQNLQTQDFDLLKRSLLNLITPDFRMPLADVTRHSETLALGIEKIETESELKESLHGIQASSVGLTLLVEDIISLAELTTGEAATIYKLQAQSINDIGYTVEEATKQVRTLADSEQATIQLAPIPAQLPPVFGVSAILRESVQRLIEAGGRQQVDGVNNPVQVQVSADTAEVQIAVRFEMPLSEAAAQEIAALFAPDKPSSFDPSAYDPGFRIVEGSVALHNGRLSLHNSLNDGITYTIHLPIHRPPTP